MHEIKNYISKKELFISQTTLIVKKNCYGVFLGFIIYAIISFIFNLIY